MIDNTEQQLLAKAREQIWIEANNLATEHGVMSKDIKEILNRLKHLIENVDAKRMFQISEGEDS